MRAETAWREEQCSSGPSQEGWGLPLPLSHWGPFQVGLGLYFNGQEDTTGFLALQGHFQL